MEDATADAAGRSMALSPLDIRNAAVVGAGAMGTGIATAFAMAGVPVILVDRSMEVVDRGLAAVKANLASAVARGKLTVEAASVTGAVDYAALCGADLVVEAVFENLALKRTIFAALDQAMKPGAVLATNTSYLDIDKIAAATARPENVLGLHFFNPAHVMKLLEIVRAEKTSAATLAAGLALARRLGKTGVVARNAFGFIGNRMLNAYRTEALNLALEGATIAAIDRAMVDFGMPMGPFALMDLTGLEVNVRMRAEADPRHIDARAFKTVDRLHAEGRSGRRSGAGFYCYDPASGARIEDPSVDAMVADISESHGIARRGDIAASEILDRCLLMLVNEGAKILEERVAETSADIDATYVAGYGFPKGTGGPMRWAERRGLPGVCEAISANFERTGAARWRPATLIKTAAARAVTLDAALAREEGGRRRAPGPSGAR